MRVRILMVTIVGMLAGCISGTPKQDTYTDRAGQTTVIESDRELCVHSCNDEYSRCMDTDAAERNPEGVAPGMFGASADCRSALRSCLPGCKGR